MRRSRTSGWNGLSALRRERSAFAALGLVLLVVQLLLSGLSQGAMAAERSAAPDLGPICHSLDDGSRLITARTQGEPERSCPCLTGVCLVSAHALQPDGADAWVAARPQLARPVTMRPVASPDPRRPIDLFARASRGPPIRI